MTWPKMFTLKDYIFVIAFTLIFATGIIGNSLVIYIFKHKQKRIRPMELIMIYLAVTDLIASIFNPLLYIYFHITFFNAWSLGSFMCVIIPSITTVSVTMSLGLILLITIERCRVLANPFSGMFDKKHVHCMVALVFILSIANEIPYIKAQHVREHVVVDYKCVKLNLAPNYTQNKANSFQRNYYRCNEAPNTFEDIISEYDNSTEFSCYRQTCYKHKSCLPKNTKEYMKSRLITIVLRDVLFISVFTVCNLLIWQALDDSEHEEMLKESDVNNARKNPTKMFIMILALAIVFAILVLPKDIFYIVYLAKILNGGEAIHNALEINSALKLLQSFNSIANVFIYSRLYGSFRKTLNQVFTTFVSVVQDTKIQRAENE